VSACGEELVTRSRDRKQSKGDRRVPVKWTVILATSSAADRRGSVLSLVLLHLRFVARLVLDRLVLVRLLLCRRHSAPLLTKLRRDISDLPRGMSLGNGRTLLVGHKEKAGHRTLGRIRVLLRAMLLRRMGLLRALLAWACLLGHCSLWLNLEGE